MRRLGDLEAVVMDDLWRRDGAASVRDVMEALQPDRPLAYTTVMTVLENLYRKGFVTREKEGRAYRYVASQTREQHTATLMSEVLAGSPDQGAALLHFVEEMSQDELARLRAAMDQLPPTKGRRRR